MRNRNRHSEHREAHGRGPFGGGGRHGGGRGRGHGGGRGGRRFGGGRGRRGKPHGGGRGRARRGEARYILLDALRDGPKHGYEIIRTLEERSAGQYIPSPGTVYPTLQYLEDQGFVSASEETDRRVYQLTDSGKNELEVQAEAIAAFWARFAEQQEVAAIQPEIRFLEDELEHLNHVVWSSLGDAIAQGDPAKIREVRQAVEACKNQVREVITGPLSV